MTLRNLVLAVYATSVLLVSIIGWYALDFSQAVSALLMVPGSVPLTLAVLWGSCVVVLGILVAVLLVAFVRPLGQVREGALRIAAGDYDVRLGVSAGAEIADLQLAFNKMAKDLAARAEGEERRRRAEERYRIVFDNANIGMSQATLDGRFVAVNPALAQLLGYTVEELLGRTWMDITHPEDSLRQMQDHAGFLAGTITRYQMEKRYLRKDGSEVWVDATVALSPSEGATGPCIVVTANDITARRQAQAAKERFAADLAIFREMVNHSNDMLLVVEEATGRFVDVNDAACRRLGYSRDELLSLRVADIALGVDEALARQRYGMARREDGIVFESLDRCKDGSTFPVEVSLRMVENAGRPLAIAVVRDISERLSREERLRRSEAALRHAQKMQALGSLTGGIAHEINNMLMPILTLAGMTMKEMPEGSRARLRLGKITDAAERAKELIARLGAFTQHDGGGGPRALADLSAVVNHALSVVRPTLPATVQLEVIAGEGDLHAVVDASSLETVVVSLVSNAVDAMMGAVGRLLVAVERVEVDEGLRHRVPDLIRPAYLRLSVTDSGRGMDDETRKRMFDPFFTTKEVGAGTGLGLAVVHGIVTAHDGAIAVSSRLGEGTTVEVYIPV